MKRNKKTRRYCKFCKKHTEQIISIAKKRDRGALKRGSIQRARKRGRGRGMGNLGKWGSKPAITQFQMTGKKSSKKPDLRFTCGTCKKSTTQAQGKRMKKLELK